MKNQVHVAHVLGVPANKVVAKSKRLGGGFGGKETRRWACHSSPLCQTHACVRTISECQAAGVRAARLPCWGNPYAWGWKRKQRGLFSCVGIVLTFRQLKAGAGEACSEAFSAEAQSQLERCSPWLLCSRPPLVAAGT